MILTRAAICVFLCECVRAHACYGGGREIERLQEELERAKANQATAQQQEETEDRQALKKRANQKLAQDMEGWPRCECAC